MSHQDFDPFEYLANTAEPPPLEHMRDHASKLWLHRRKPIHPLDWITFAIYAVGLAFVLRWLP